MEWRKCRLQCLQKKYLYVTHPMKMGAVLRDRRKGENFNLQSSGGSRSRNNFLSVFTFTLFYRQIFGKQTKTIWKIQEILIFRHPTLIFDKIKNGDKKSYCEFRGVVVIEISIFETIVDLVKKKKNFFNFVFNYIRLFRFI